MAQGRSMSTEKRPLLRAQEQIDHLKTKGVVFDLCTEIEAMNYLAKNNNYFKLRAFRNGFFKNQYGPDAGKYAHLDFAYLQDLSIIDMRLRYYMLPVALDIEHSAKVNLLEKLDQIGDDGYEALNELMRLDGRFKERVDKDLSQRFNDPYCCDLIKKYSENLPAWVFSEAVSFGSFLSFYKFIGDKTSDKDMKDNFYLLLSVKRLRNACAHSNCVLNDLSVHKEHMGQNSNMNHRLRDEIKKAGVSNDTRSKKMSNPRIFDLVTTMYAHTKIVSSEGRQDQIAKSMQLLKNRMFYHISYYQLNDTISSSFNFLEKMINHWYPCDIVTA